MTETMKSFKGSSNAYVDIGVRSDGETLALGLEYASHPSGTGYLVTRFVAHSPDGTLNPLTHFAVRAKATFRTETGEKFDGTRLDKVAFPIFEPAVPPCVFGKFAEEHDIFPKIAAWIGSQMEKDGFVPLVNLEEAVRFLLVPETTAKNVLEFPDIAALRNEAKAAFAAMYAKSLSKHDDGDDGDDDEDDDDTDEESIN